MFVTGFLSSSTLKAGLQLLSSLSVNKSQQTVVKSYANKRNLPQLSPLNLVSETTCVSLDDEDLM